MISALAAVLLSAGACAAPAGVAIGIGTTTYTVSSLYTGDRVRDPFRPHTAASAARRASEEPEELDIHALRLNGILKDRSADYAILSTNGGETFLLRAGKLYDQRRKRVPGVSGRIDVRQRRVTLIGVDGDVQRYTLGESAEDEGQRPSRRGRDQ